MILLAKPQCRHKTTVYDPKDATKTHQQPKSIDDHLSTTQVYFPAGCYQFCRDEGARFSYVTYTLFTGFTHECLNREAQSHLFVIRIPMKPQVTYKGIG